MIATLQKTSRRESREAYARFLMDRCGFEHSDIEEFLNTKQVVLGDLSPIELIYTGDYKAAIAAVESFTEDLQTEENE